MGITQILNKAPLILSVIALLISIVSVVVTVLGWRRQRNIYDIERYLFFRHNRNDQINNNELLKKKLNSGHFTILHMGKQGDDIEVFLGKIKK